MKRITALLLVLVVFLAGVPAVSAASFTDVPDDYRKPYIDDMTERGLFTGYADGTFRPDKEITLLESLVLLSRICSLDQEAKQLVLDAHKSILMAILSGKGLDWAYENLSICLETGILTREELISYASAGALTKPIQKELLAVLLIRTMQLEESALRLSDYKLSFDDYLIITISRRPYVYLLNQIGVVQGDNFNRFNPSSSVNRAIASIMVSRTLGYMEDHGIELKITRFSEYKTNGVLAEVANGNILVKDYNGTATRVAVPGTVSIKADGKSTLLAKTYVGNPVTLVWSKDDKSLKGLEIDTKTTVLQGSFNSVYQQSAVHKLYLADPLTGTVTGYNLASQPSVSYENAAVALSSLKAGNFITAFLQNDSVTAIYGYSGNYEFDAVLTDRVFGVPIVLTLKDSSGREQEIHLNPAAPPVITRGGQVSAVDKLYSGDQMKVTVKNSVVSRIDVQTKQADLSGTIRRIVKDVSGNILTIVKEDGTEASFSLASGATITQKNVRLTLDELKIGSKVKLSMSDSLVVVIEVEEATAVTDILNGTIMFINSAEQSLLVQKAGSGATDYITVKLSSNTKVLKASNGSYLTLSSLKIYDVVDIYGINSGNRFDATIIIVR